MRGNTWRRGGLSGSSHRQAPNGRPKQASDQPCRFFAQGKCAYGSKCKFSHDRNGHQSSDGRQPRARPPTLDEDNDEEAFNLWRVNIRRAPSQYPGLSLHLIWKAALTILDGDGHQDRQQLVRDLVDDKYHGGDYLKLSLQTRPSLSDVANQLMIENFPKTITHDTVLDCLSIETYTGTLYNMISGAGGERAIAFFRDLCRDTRTQMCEELSGSQIKSLGRITESIIVALHELVIREKRVSLHKDMPNLLTELDQSCPRRRSTCDHACPKTCGEECGLCQVPVDGVVLPCGHLKDRVPCWETQQPAKIRCNVSVRKLVGFCEHAVNVSCSTDVKSEDFRCPQPCTQVLECGHVCPGHCAKCHPQSMTEDQSEHQTCKKPCGRPRNTCNHLCNIPCHGDGPCPPCSEKCEVLCAHSQCAQPCSDPCAPCIERCAWSCEHRGRCSMPCAAPCNRLPCDKRCKETLKCGHQCPSLCGEVCPQGYCQVCDPKGEARVDLLEFKMYNEIDLEDTPIVVLSCGHFFTAESLDGLVGLNNVYRADMQGEFVGLADPAEMFAVPTCPDCKRSVKQHATRRYNRVVNIAVMNETSKRFVVKGQLDLHELNKAIDEAALELHNDRQPPTPGYDEEMIQGRHSKLKKLSRRAKQLCKAMSADRQPSKKLADAVRAAKATGPLESRFENLNLEEQKAPLPEYSAIFGGELAHLRIQEIMVQDILIMMSGSVSAANQSTQKCVKSVKALLHECERLVEKSSEQNFPRIAVAATLSYARVVRGMQGVASNISDGEVVGITTVENARHLLEAAEGMCKASFQGSQELVTHVQRMIKVLRGPWYEAVTQEELDAIKSAMVSDPRGIATHSGHWYECQNGHPFTIGECGMPMQLARCPECGAQIGGQNHVMVEGMSRAERFEH